MNSITVVVMALCSLCVYVVESKNPPNCPSDASVAYYPNEDCSKFWQCDDGQAVLQSCPPNLRFNINTNVCDWPANVNCPNSGDDGDKNDDEDGNNENGDNDSNNGDDNNDDNENDDEDSNKTLQCENVECPLEDGDFVVHRPGPECSKFCKCAKGIAHLQNCPDGLYFNAALEVCDYPQNSGCVDNNDGEDEVDGNRENTPADNNETDNEGVENESNGQDGNEPNGCENVECPLEDGDFVVHRPGPECSKFCKCSRGIAYVHNCPVGLYFNAAVEVCDYPKNSNCVDDGEDEVDNNIENEQDNNNDSEVNEIDNEGVDNDKDVNEPTGCENVECPLEDSEVVVHRPGPNCNKFCKCSRGTAYLQTCPVGLHFNAALEVCDYPENSGCTDYENVPSDNAEDELNDNQAAAEEIDDSGNQITCAAPCPSEDNTPFPASNCNNYCICSNGAQYVMTCPSDLEFNSKLGFCDWPDNAGCSRKN